MEPLWFSPICDDLLKKIAWWHLFYERGEVESTRKFLNKDHVVVDRPTRYAHRIPFRQNEVDHLLRIMTALAPKSEVTKEVAKLQAGLKRGRLLPGGAYLVTIAWWQDDLKEILDVLDRAKSGQRETLEETLAKQKQDGKELFEV